MRKNCGPHFSLTVKSGLRRRLAIQYPFGGFMSALTAGVHAPDIQLNFIDGTRFSLDNALKQGPVVVAFFKVSCPVCQLAFPYIERIFKAYKGRGKFTLVGVSQDDAQDTQAFNREFGITFPMLLDTKGYPVSNAYGLTNVPTIFLISPQKEIETTTVSWSREEMEDLNKRLAEISGVPAAQIFTAADQVPVFKPG
jgi:peroxiredoxin